MMVTLRRAKDQARLPSGLFRLGKRPMRQSLALMSCLMVLALLWAGLSSSSAQASPVFDCTSASVVLEAHAPGDGDEVPGHPGNPKQHHHGGCQNHALSVPTVDRPLASATEARTEWRMFSSNGPASIVAASDLRPPIS